MIQLHGIKTGKQTENFRLVECILSSLKKNKTRLENNDVLAISSKFVALAEGRIVKLSSIKAGRKAKEISRKLGMKPEMAQLVLDEAEKIFSGVENFLLAIKDGMIAPNAGIDRSNIYPGYAILYPENSFKAAENIRKEIHRKTGKNIGVVITDSRLMPTRIGTTGIAIAVSGLEPVQNCIGKKDLFGNRLKYTKRALADDMAAAAQMLMGETNEAVPVVLLRAENPPWKFTGRKIKKTEMAIDWRKDIYICGLRRTDI